MAHWIGDNQSTLKGDEFDRRCHEVFIDDDETYVFYCGIIDHGDGWATVYGWETFYGIETSGPEDPNIYPISVDYKMNMTERPHALAYLLGERDDFDD